MNAALRRDETTRRDARNEVSARTLTREVDLRTSGLRGDSISSCCLRAPSGRRTTPIAWRRIEETSIEHGALHHKVQHSISGCLRHAKRVRQESVTQCLVATKSVANQRLCDTSTGRQFSKVNSALHIRSRHTKLYSFRFNCKIVSFTAANTNRMFSVSAKQT